MKTFREFILEAEAEIKWNTGSLKGSGKSPSDTAKQKQAQLNRTAREKPSPEVSGRVSRMKRGISGATALAKDDPNDQKPETTATRMQRTGRVSKNTLTTGNASKPRDTSRRGGSLPNIAASADDNMARRGQRTTGRYTGNQHGQTGSGGTGTDSTGASKLGGRR
jgi:hypothetical protein